jgi:hypothetical protein
LTAKQYLESTSGFLFIPESSQATFLADIGNKEHKSLRGSDVCGVLNLIGSRHTHRRHRKGAYTLFTEWSDDRKLCWDKTLTREWVESISNMLVQTLQTCRSSTRDVWVKTRVTLTLEAFAELLPLLFSPSSMGGMERSILSRLEIQHLLEKAEDALNSERGDSISRAMVTAESSEKSMRSVSPLAEGDGQEGNAVRVFKALRRITDILGKMVFVDHDRESKMPVTPPPPPPPPALASVDPGSSRRSSSSPSGGSVARDGKEEAGIAGLSVEIVRAMLGTLRELQLRPCSKSTPRPLLFTNTPSPKVSLTQLLTEFDGL